MTLGVRPAALRIAPTGMPARVYLVEDLGDTTIVDLDIAGHIVKLRTEARPNVREGDNVHVAFAADACHLFERDSGTRRARLTRRPLLHFRTTCGSPTRATVARSVARR